MNPELLQLHDQLIHCTQPEDLFGKLLGDPLAQQSALKSLYRRFARIAHVDVYQRLDEQRLAHLAFTKLNTLHQQAADKILAGIYGTAKTVAHKTNTPSIMKSRNHTYVIEKGIIAGDASLIYTAEREDGLQMIIKMAKHHSLNDLLDTEAIALKALNKAAVNTVSYKQFIPTLADTFSLKFMPANKAASAGVNDVRHVNVFHAVDGYKSLSEVMAVYPSGVDGRHFVWMFNRLLTVLSFAHMQGVVHGAVLPPHVLIHPVTHAIHLLDWCFTRPTGKPIVALSKGYAAWYPPEATEHRPLTAATDIYMAAMAMCYILGADYGEGLDKTDVHPKFRRLLQSCLIKNQFRRPQSAWHLCKEFLALSEEVYGPKKYLRLEMSA